MVNLQTRLAMQECLTRNAECCYSLCTLERDRDAMAPERNDSAAATGGKS